jgi:KDO2-lipid IV(A) lauroyltransferase
MINKLIYGNYLFLKLLIKIVPKNIIKYILIALSRLVYIFDYKHNKIVLANLKMAFNNRKTIDEKKYILKMSYENLFFNLYEFIINKDLTLKQLEDKVTIENEEIILDAIKSKRKIILITAHYGNWELGTIYNSAKYRPMTVVGRSMSNKYLNSDLKKARTSHNAQMLEKDGSAKSLIKALEKNRMLGLAVDQNTSNNRGILIDFFGKKARQTNSSAKLAKKFNALIIPMFVVKNGFCDYTIKYNKPIDINSLKSEDIIFEATQLQADVIQKQIELLPQHWFWQHKRWKNQYEYIYE